MSTITISNSKSNTYRRCPKAYDFKYERKLRKKLIGLPLKRGDWLHQLLMVHFDGQDWKKRHAQLTREFNKLFDEEKEEYGDLPTECSRIMRSYLAHYKGDDKKWRVVDTELNETVELPNGDKFNLIIDKIAEDLEDGGLWIIDYKTVGKFFREDFMLIDAQLARYFWGARKLGYKGLRGVMLDEVITKPPTIPKYLEPSNRLEQRKNIHCDAYTYYGEVKRLGLSMAAHKEFLLFLKARHKEWFRRTRIPRDSPMVKTLMRELMWTADEIKDATAKGRFPRTSRKECLFDCDYLTLCILELQGADISDEVNMKYKVSKRETDVDTVGWVPKGK